MIEPILYTKELELETVLKALDKFGVGVQAFVDKDGKLVGIITDGDIRRGILNKKTLHKMINFNPKKISCDLSYEETQRKLKSLKTRHLPIVDEDNTLIDILVLDDINLGRNKNKVVIMAGGIGSRLGSLTKNRPKPMLNVGSKPLLENMISLLRDQGFYDFYISVNFKSEIIKNYFGDGLNYGVNIKYLEEDKPLGTAGSLSLIEDVIEDPLLIINGDIITTQNFNSMISMHNKKSASVTVGVKEHIIQNPYGVLCVENGEIKRLEEKPVYSSLINAGIYVLNASELQNIPKDSFYNMTDLLDSIIKDGKISVAYQIKSYWIDIGHARDYEQANQDMSYL